MPINTSVQEDAQEFLNTLMSNIEDELKLKK